MNLRPARPIPEPAACGIMAHALVEARVSEIAALRDAPAPEGVAALPARFLRHCDEQTVVGMHAVLQSIAAHPRPRPSFDGHGVVAAACQSGRVMAARSLALLKTGGAVTVSTHIVPQGSLHSLAGAVSVGLGMHGPHVGISGGPDALAEGLFAALSFSRPAAAPLPGLWLIVTEWDREPTLDRSSGDVCDDPICRALAVALEPGADAPLTLTLRTPPPGAAVDAAPLDAPPSSQLAEFAQALAMCGEGGALISWALVCPWGAEVRIGRSRRAALDGRSRFGMREAA